MIYDNLSLPAGNQYGFTKGHSKEDAISRAVLSVQSIESKYILGIFIDISGAFDNLSWNGILNRIAETRCTSKLYTVFRDYFSDRETLK